MKLELFIYMSHMLINFTFNTGFGVCSAHAYIYCFGPFVGIIYILFFVKS